MVGTKTSELARIVGPDGQQDDGQVGVLGANRLRQLWPRPFAETSVQQHQARRVRGNGLFCLGGSRGMADDVPVFCQGLSKHLAENGIVFNHQESRRV